MIDDRIILKFANKYAIDKETPSFQEREHISKDEEWLLSHIGLDPYLDLKSRDYKKNYQKHLQYKENLEKCKNDPECAKKLESIRPGLNYNNDFAGMARVDKYDNKNYVKNLKTSGTLDGYIRILSEHLATYKNMSGYKLVKLNFDEKYKIIHEQIMNDISKLYEYRDELKAFNKKYKLQCVLNTVDINDVMSIQTSGDAIYRKYNNKVPASIIKTLLEISNIICNDLAKLL